MVTVIRYAPSEWIVKLRGLGPWLIFGAGAALVMALIHWGALIDGLTSPELSWNPISLVLQFATGQAMWPRTTTSLLIAVVVLLSATFIYFWVRPRGRGRKARARELATRVSEGQDVRRVQRKARKSELQHLHPDLEKKEMPGVPIGRTLTGNREWVLQSYRQCGAHVWGPGRGKTGTQVARHALTAPGAYLMTTNKTDGVRHVIAARTLTHPTGRILLFDPEQVFRPSSRPTFTFDLFAGIHDTQTALDLAEVFEASSKPSADAKGDTHFDPTGRGYLAWCLLAAAVSNAAPGKVSEWVNAGETTEVAKILRKHGYIGPVAALTGLAEQPEKTRGSVFSTAQRMVAPMIHDHLMRWVTPTPGVPVFDAESFVTSTDTLILLSREKAGPLAAFISALLLNLFKAAQDRARHEPTERLPRPMLADLDECGNTVTLPMLPDWFTHFGSKGIVISAYFQSPSQGEGVFGRAGFAQLWDAAGTRVYGGGVDDADWLGKQSKLLGTYDKRRVTHSEDTYGRASTAATSQDSDRATVAQLANLPEWRAIVRTSNGVSVMVETVPVWEDKAFDKVLKLAAEIKA